MFLKPVFFEHNPVITNKNTVCIIFLFHTILKSIKLKLLSLYCMSVKLGEEHR